VTVAKQISWPDRATGLSCLSVQSAVINSTTNIVHR